MSELVTLVTAWEEFAARDAKGDVYAFAGWLLNQKAAMLPQEQPVVYTGSIEEMLHAEDPGFDRFEGKNKSSMQAAYLMVRLNQFVLFYSKPIMKKYGLHSIYDFAYLQNVKAFSNITKTKVCELMLHEVTTGMDIIKRLLRHGFLKEAVNTGDKREKLLRLTTKGEQVLHSMFTEFLQLPDTLGDMPDIERTTLLRWMMELERYHLTLINNNYR